MKKKVLFFIYQLIGGGAEKVMVDIVNHMDPTLYEVTVMTIIDCSSDAHILNSEVRYKSIFMGKYKEDRIFFKLFYMASPKLLHQLFIKDIYDIEIAALEGIPAKIISGCNFAETKKIAVIHADASKMAWPSKRYKDYYQELNSYKSFDSLLFVSKNTQIRFMDRFPIDPGKIITIYNPFDFTHIINSSLEQIDDYKKTANYLFCAVGRLEKVKGFDRLIDAFYSVRENYPNISLLILGEGRDREDISQLITKYKLDKHITLLGYRTNPYKYIKMSDCYICSSYSEGLSSTVIEARILGVPVIATDCGGMDELLEDYQKGILVKNDTSGLITGMEQLLKNIDCYKCSEEAQEKLNIQRFSIDHYIDRIQKIM